MLENTIKKVQDAISTLDETQLDKVLNYVEGLRKDILMNQRAQISEDAIRNGKVFSLDQFNKDFEAWKIAKRLSRNL